ncbi:hypothetical protein A5699_16040 [Mycobacterium sp. E802]|nr:hypothetical protein A5699_16040 [Mycobacterium sp. E802]
MFAEMSIGAVSLRGVAREAGVANRAVAYHFTSKRDLVAAVAHRRSREIFPDTAERLHVLAKETDITVRDVVEALVAPHVRLLELDPVGGLRWLKVMTQLALDDDPIWIQEMAMEPSLAELFVVAARRAVPDLKTAKVRQRTTLAIFSMISALAGSDLAAYGRPLTGEGLDPQWLDQLIEFTCGGLRGNSA